MSNIIILSNNEFFRKHNAIMKANVEKLTIFYREEETWLDLRFINYTLFYKTIILKEKIKELLTQLKILNENDEITDIKTLNELFKKTMLEHTGEEVLGFE